MQTQLDIIPIVIWVWYTLFMLLLSRDKNDRYVLLESSKKNKQHSIFAIILSIIWIYQIFLSDKIFYGNLFYFIPLLHILLLAWSDILMKTIYKRGVIPANKFNMINASQRWAIRLDFVAFIITHFLPILIAGSLLKN